MDVVKKLESKFQQIADLTWDHCKKTCSMLGSCCHTAYCDMTIDYAKDEFGVVLERTQNKSLPLLGDDGVCTAAPYLRPVCSLHSCDINGLGFFKNEPKLTKRYFKLREEVDQLEYERKYKHG